MKTVPRTEWNGLPGYLASLKLNGDSPDAALKHLELGFDGMVVREFMKAPMQVIAKKFQSKDLTRHNEAEEDLNQLVIKMILIGVCAERERVEEEMRHSERSG
jgi:hypothetical protein